MPKFRQKHGDQIPLVRHRPRSDVNKNRKKLKRQTVRINIIDP